ncbi:WxL domain-containing protein [Enterococcus casseliflavus]|uniref:WxL domain-containing protein n=1 Tax=Enterococcus casseliflavus TaxID=37734 RepID=UPI0023D7CC60|nr:WxL domain-containing protein [Enterococcus casseliflavus]WEI91774.1 WxL domain-containing protein [Enterococcus casseliflavus]
MKWIRLATVASLTSTIFAGGVQAVANDEPTPNQEPSGERRRQNTENNIEFRAGDGESVEVVPPVPYPPVTIVDPDPPTGPLTIAHVPKKFDFGVQRISTANVSYPIIAEQEKLVTGDDEEEISRDNDEEVRVPFVSFAQIVDTRGLIDSQWELNLDLTEFTTSSGENLRGAYLELLEPTIVHNEYTEEELQALPDDHEDRDYLLQLLPNAFTTPNELGNESLIIHANSTNVTVMSATDGQGQGVSSIYWGDQEELNAAHESETDPVLNHAIRLHIPGTATPQAAEYTATLTWHLTSAMDANGETVPN